MKEREKNTSLSHFHLSKSILLSNMQINVDKMSWVGKKSNEKDEREKKVNWIKTNEILVLFTYMNINEITYDSW